MLAHRAVVGHVQSSNMPTTFIIPLFIAVKLVICLVERATTNKIAKPVGKLLARNDISPGRLDHILAIAIIESPTLGPSHVHLPQSFYMIARDIYFVKPQS